MARNFLRVEGETIVDASGSPVILRGVGLGGWMNMENFITGYPASESAMREAVSSVLGAAPADRFFELLLDHFFSAAEKKWSSRRSKNRSARAAPSTAETASRMALSFAG